MSDISEQLNKLVELKNAGHLTDEEFAAAKAKLIGSEASSESEPSPKPTESDVLKPTRFGNFLKAILTLYICYVAIETFMKEDPSFAASNRILSAQEVDKVIGLCQNGILNGEPVSQDDLSKELPRPKVGGLFDKIWRYDYQPRGSSTTRIVSIYFSDSYCTKVTD